MGREPEGSSAGLMGATVGPLGTLRPLGSSIIPSTPVANAVGWLLGGGIEALGGGTGVRGGSTVDGPGVGALEGVEALGAYMGTTNGPTCLVPVGSGLCNMLFHDSLNSPNPSLIFL